VSSPGLSSFAATQALWRFLNNERVTLPALAEPLRAAAREAIARRELPCVLVVHDWCKLDYRRHGSKRDVVQLTHARDVGYELGTALLVSPADGSPLAPVELRLRTAEGVHSTRDEKVSAACCHVDQVLPTMEASDGWELGVPCVHVIDREGDSVGHFRRWSAGGHLFLVRADDRRVVHAGRSVLLSEVAEELASGGRFREVGDVEYRGGRGRQEVAEVEVVLDRPAQRRGRDGRRRVVPGDALVVRVVISRIRDSEGRVAAQWLLVTNVPGELAAGERLARWYYWRWRIESFFKLLKSAGHEIEHWQQQSGMAIARRLLVVAMACVVVWELERNESVEGRELKRVLIRLSGRQTSRRRPVTAPALLAGLLVLLPILDLLEAYDGDLRQLRDLALKAIPFLDTG